MDGNWPTITDGNRATAAVKILSKLPSSITDFESTSAFASLITIRPTDNSAEFATGDRNKNSKTSALPNEVFAVAAKRRLFEEPGHEFVVLNDVDIFLLERSFATADFEAEFRFAGVVVVVVLVDFFFGHGGKSQPIAHCYQ